MAELTKIELTEQDAESFKAFCQYQQQFLNVAKNWKQVHEFAANMQFGSFTLTIKDGVPVRIDNPLQVLILTKI